MNDERHWHPGRKILTTNWARAYEQASQGLGEMRLIAANYALARADGAFDALGYTRAEIEAIDRVLEFMQFLKDSDLISSLETEWDETDLPEEPEEQDAPAAPPRLRKGMRPHIIEGGKGERSQGDEGGG